MKILLFLFQLILASYNSIRCVALELKCSGSTFSYRFHGGCVRAYRTLGKQDLNFNGVCNLSLSELRPPRIREGECGNTAKNQENGGLQWTNRVTNELLGIDETLTCRQGPSDGVFAPSVESQTREFRWNSLKGKFEIINAFGMAVCSRETFDFSNSKDLVDKRKRKKKRK
ncbi:Oidioi.mRNA.OKI2018_I69.chr1.g389.t1.cds [Oikopleura dioica]|uniref:Oidioi.mRNA.OKI2018_I69.chr1.g389.t1.cds n=1 Tax=Oikopleura dioica TaxID=34765 RepID=A0ABN7STZ0_OIKDI|nr:Oidioi.mRNA.OKI2018_I69.chr1.g389.t1.cds [Oikopleura dioica]